jgi:hypothetical protein
MSAVHPGAGISTPTKRCLTHARHNLRQPSALLPRQALLLLLLLLLLQQPFA